MRDTLIANDTTWQNLPERLAREQLVDISPEWVIRHYREWYPGMTPTEVLRAAATAGRSWRPHLIQAEARAAQHGPTWMYQLDFGSPLFGGRLGAYHTFDISLIFDNIDKPGAEVGDTPLQLATAQRVSDQMSGMLLQFARTGNPQTAFLPRWPTYDLARRSTMVFDLEAHIDHDPRGQERRLYSAVPYLKPGT
jgi:para-nitrobenzyl esterase